MTRILASDPFKLPDVLDTPVRVLECLHTMVFDRDRQVPSIVVLPLDHQRRPHKVLLPINDRPPQPDRELCDRLMETLLRAFDGLPLRLLVAVTRPGKDYVSTADRDWAAALREAADRRGVPLEPVHLATPAAVRAIEPR